MTTTTLSSPTKTTSPAKTTKPLTLASVLEPRADLVYRGLCILVGVLFAFHGAQGLFGWFLPPGVEIPVGSQVWIGKVIELATGTAIAVGVATRWAAFVASGTMAVAYVQFHWKLALDEQFLPAVNQGEPALLFSVLFLYIACRGARR